MYVYATAANELSERLVWVSEQALFPKADAGARSAGSSGVVSRLLLGLPHGEIRGVRDWVASGSELQAVGAKRESGCLEVENVSASRTQRRIKAKIAAGIRVTRRGCSTGVAGRAGDPTGMQRHGSGGDVFAAGIAEVQLDRERRATGNRSCRTVQRVERVGNVFSQSSGAAEEAVVAAVSRGDRMRSNGKRRSCQCG